MEEYKIKIFDLALEGMDEEELFQWYEKEYPHQGSDCFRQSQFITNCFLDIYHFRHKVLTNLNFGRDRIKKYR